MARQVVWLPGAEADIVEIGSYLERVASAAVATSVVTKIRATALRVVNFPYAFRMIRNSKTLTGVRPSSTNTV
jgi:plasmid stabilization system protein ParE